MLNGTQTEEVPVVIFCGGKGTRLKEETEFKPKPMVSIGGRPIVWHIMKTYAHYGHRTFILCLGYKGNLIKEYFLNHKLFTCDFSYSTREGSVITCYPNEHNDDFRIIFADTGEDTPTGERLRLVQKYIPQNRFFVTYGDGVANIDIRALLAFHLRKGLVGTITGVHPWSKYGLVTVDAEERVAAFEQKPRLHDYVNGGFMVFERAFFEYIKPEAMIEDALVAAAADRTLALYFHNDFWHCMDTYKDYEDLNRLWHENPAWKVWR